MKASEQARKDTSPRKINVTSKSPVGDISVVTLIRTDTTLDHSQKVEKACHTGCSVLHSVKTWWLQIFRTLKQVTLWIGLPQSTFQLPKLVKSHCCVPFTATFRKRRKIGAPCSERCDEEKNASWSLWLHRLMNSCAFTSPILLLSLAARSDTHQDICKQVMKSDAPQS